MPNKGWWGFDMDATIAFYETWGDGSTGAPIKPMIRRMKHYLRIGRKVAIVTARVHPSEPAKALQEDFVRNFLNKNIGVEAASKVDIRYDKDRHMIALYDDRAEQVIPNKGILVREELRRAVLALQEIATYAAGVDDMELSELVSANLKNLDPWSLDLAFNN
jgi:hypothetical protein